MSVPNKLCEFYKTLVEKSSDPMVVHQDGKIVYANPTAAKELGYEPREFVNVELSRFLPEKVREKVVNLYEKRIRGEEVTNVYEITVKDKDGKLVPFELRAELIDYQGKPAVLATLRNIEKRKEAEKIINDKYRKLRRVLNEKNFGIFETTVAGTIIYVNDSFAKLLGYEKAEDLIRKKASSVYALPEERQKLIEKLKQKGELHNEVLTFVKADGSLGQFEATEFLEKDRITGFLWEHNMNKNEEDLIIVCSYCRKFKHGRKWLHPDEFMRLNKSMIQNTDYDFSHGICAGCKEEILESHEVK